MPRLPDGDGLRSDDPRPRKSEKAGNDLERYPRTRTDRSNDLERYHAQNAAMRRAACLRRWLLAGAGIAC